MVKQALSEAKAAEFAVEIKKAEAAVTRAEHKVEAAKENLKGCKAEMATAIARLRTLATGQGEFFAGDEDVDVDDE
jgi:outer membrane murein-binding lipoprotein Lpp